MNDCDLPGRHFESYLVFPYIHIIFDAVIVNVATGEFPHVQKFISSDRDIPRLFWPHLLVVSLQGIASIWNLLMWDSMVIKRLNIMVN